MIKVKTQHHSQQRPATTTAEQDRKTKGQRIINALWEVTQSFVAICVTSVTLYVAAIMAKETGMSGTAFSFLTNVFFVVIGFYFGRTNHDKTGGIGGMNVVEPRGA